MTPTYCYTALIDVLAYRYRLEQDQKSGNFTFKEDLENALSILNTVNSVIYNVQAISDTIIITCSSHENFLNFLNIIKEIFISFLDRGLFIRGGIAYSKHFQSGRLTYSHAIARAYEIESKNSVFPRIVIDENIIEMYEGGNSLPEIFGKGLLIKQNDVVFLDVINADNWDKCYDLASAIYRKDEDNLKRNEGAFLKHQWFERYLFESPFANSAKEKYTDQFKRF